MATEKNINKLEREIRAKMMQIRSGKTTPKDSGIAKLINMMKSFDEPLHGQIMNEYKQLITK